MTTLPKRTTLLRCGTIIIALSALLAGCRPDTPETNSGADCEVEGNSYIVAFRVSTKDGVILADGEVDEYETMSVFGDDDSKALGFRPDVRGSNDGKCLVDFAVLVIYDPLVGGREVFDSSVRLLEGESADVKVPFEKSHVDLQLLGVRGATDTKASEKVPVS